MTAVKHDSPATQPVSVTADTQKGIIHAQADIDATPERVFRALTTPEMADWWGQDGMYRTHDYVIDLRPGGRWSCKATGGDGAESTVGGEYITVEPPRVLEYTWEPSWDNFAVSRVRIDIEPRGAGSRVKIVHTGFEGREQMAQNHADGWGRVLGWLASYVSRR